MIEVNFLSTAPVKELDLITLFDSAIQQVFKHLELNHDDFLISIRITDNREIQELNKNYRSVDAPTDILSFTADEFNPETQLTYLGDLVISHEKVKMQADSAEHPLTTEYSLMVVHGTLHLLGYDHAELEEKEHMWNLQKTILAELSIFPKKLPEE